ncbi:MAG: S16 family serine protease, partial [Verrucomicrobiota bacterium]|nr:S16 family serine protease [Verrucomicrobiota bacterium]
MKPIPYHALIICVVLLFPGLRTHVRAQDEDRLFYLPDMEAELFDTASLDFGRRGTFDKSGLVAALARIASDFDPEEKNGNVPNLLRSNALGIAGRINPDAKSFKTTYEQLEKAAEAYGSSGTSKDRLVGNIFRGVRTLLKDKDNEDNQICAAYCVDVALRLLPGHKYAGDLEKIQQDLEKNGVEIDWDQLQGKAVVKETPWNPFGQGGRMEPRKEKMPGGKAKGLASNQSSVVGLVVVTLGSGKHAGAAAEIIATALREEGVKGVEFKIDQKVGDMMGNSLKSIRDYLRVTYEPKGMVPDGYEVSIVFQDRDQRVDGPSAGTAMALMLDALFSGEKIDDEFACTGGITPNGKVTSIGGVAAKIRGATRRKCRIVGVPDGNAKGVNDILVLDGIQLLGMPLRVQRPATRPNLSSRCCCCPELRFAAALLSSPPSTCNCRRPNDYAPPPVGLDQVIIPQSVSATVTSSILPG